MKSYLWMRRQVSNLCVGDRIFIEDQPEVLGMDHDPMWLVSSEGKYMGAEIVDQGL